MRKVWEIGGIVAAAILVAFGIGALVMSINGRSTVGSNLKEQQIVGTADMTPAGITAEVKQAGLKNVSIPSCSVANKTVLNGATARCFAQYMQIHSLEATGGFFYSQMGQYEAQAGAPKAQLAAGGGTNNPQYAAIDPQTKQPVSNGARNVWVTETALTTALNTSFMASQLALFGIVVGIALLLAGIGFGILAVGPLRDPERALSFSKPKKTKVEPVPTV
ncbi:MAG TPA: hypothetical protein VJ375_10905 [Gaiellaceae bacterium]|nr:hypothetical protein [Gaiellaceae bacterium]